MYDCLTNVIDNAQDRKLYACQSFSGASRARKLLEYSLSDKAAEDRQQVEEALEAGSTLEEACAPYLTDETFDAWYTEFDSALKAAVQ